MLLSAPPLTCCSVFPSFPFLPFVFPSHPQLFLSSPQVKEDKKKKGKPKAKRNTLSSVAADAHSVAAVTGKLASMVKGRTVAAATRKPDVEPLQLRQVEWVMKQLVDDKVKQVRNHHQHWCCHLATRMRISAILWISAACEFLRIS